MATTTSRFGLKKPGTTDFYNIADHNGNMDIIDQHMVDASDKATNEEAIAGTDDTKWMTPLKTKSAVDAGVSSIYGIGDIKSSTRNLESLSGGKYLACDGRQLLRGAYPTICDTVGGKLASMKDIVFFSPDSQKTKSVNVGPHNTRAGYTFPTAVTIPCIKNMVASEDGEVLFGTVKVTGYGYDDDDGGTPYCILVDNSNLYPAVSFDKGETWSYNTSAGLIPFNSSSLGNNYLSLNNVEPIIVYCNDYAYVFPCVHNNINGKVYIYSINRTTKTMTYIGTTNYSTNSYSGAERVFGYAFGKAFLKVDTAQSTYSLLVCNNGAVQLITITGITGSPDYFWTDNSYIYVGVTGSSTVYRSSDLLAWTTGTFTVNGATTTPNGNAFVTIGYVNGAIYAYNYSSKVVLRSTNGYAFTAIGVITLDASHTIFTPWGSIMVTKVGNQYFATANGSDAVIVSDDLTNWNLTYYGYIAGVSTAGFYNPSVIVNNSDSIAWFQNSEAALRSNSDNNAPSAYTYHNWYAKFYQYKIRAITLPKDLTTVNSVVTPMMYIKALEG